MFRNLHCDIIGEQQCNTNLIALIKTIWSNIEVETDAEGIQSSSLRSILEQWPTEKPKPKVLYTVPVSYFIHSSHRRCF